MPPVVVSHSGQTSVRNVVSGNPSPLTRCDSSVAPHAKRTAMGSVTLSLCTTIVSPSIVAVASEHARSLPAIAKCSSAPGDLRPLALASSSRNPVALDLHRAVRRILTAKLRQVVRLVQCMQCEAMTYIALVRGVDVRGVADVDRRGHRGVGRLGGGDGLCFLEQCRGTAIILVAKKGAICTK